MEKIHEKQLINFVEMMGVYQVNICKRKPIDHTLSVRLWPYIIRVEKSFKLMLFVLNTEHSILVARRITFISCQKFILKPVLPETTLIFLSGIPSKIWVSPMLIDG